MHGTMHERQHFKFNSQGYGEPVEIAERRCHAAMVPTVYRPLSRRLDRCDRVIHNESGEPNGGNMCSFSGRRVRRVYVTMQITFLTRKSALIYRRGLRQRVASLTLNCNGDFAIRAYTQDDTRCCSLHHLESM